MTVYIMLYYVDKIDFISLDFISLDSYFTLKTI